MSREIYGGLFSAFAYKDHVRIKKTGETGIVDDFAFDIDNTIVDYHVTKDEQFRTGRFSGDWYLDDELEFLSSIEDEQQC